METVSLANNLVKPCLRNISLCRSYFRCTDHVAKSIMGRVLRSTNIINQNDDINHDF